MPARKDLDDEKRKIPTFAYIGVHRYRERLDHIQSAIYDSLAENDKRFEGDDGIEGALIFGSYAKSFPITEGRTLVHNKVKTRRGHIPASDIDLAYFSRLTLPGLGELNSEDRHLAGLSGVGRFSFDENLPLRLIASPGWRLDSLIKRNLEQKYVFTEPDHYCYLHFETPNQMIEDLAQGPNSVLRDFGLVFIHKESPAREEILAILRRSRLPMVLDPATTAEVLVPPRH